MTDNTQLGLQSIDQFRQMFPVFGDPQVYTDVEITPWYTVAGQLFDPTVWQGLLSLTQSLYIAHNLVLAERDQRAVAAGGIPGSSGSGILASKSVGGVSASYDTGSALEQGAGYYNLTTYGTRLYRLIKLAGMGGVQIGGPPIFAPVGAWPGVIPAPDKRNDWSD